MLKELITRKATERVARAGTRMINRSLDKAAFEKTKERIAQVASGGTEAIDRRLHRLDREWDVERVMQANVAGLTLAGLALGLTVNRKFYAIPAAVGAMLLQHAIIGWSPTVALLRQIGVRTRAEIEFERYALKALRGDFHGAPTAREIEGGNISREVERTLEATRS